MAKQGEGSHGGHIVGHTKSGKAIYGDHHDTAAKVETGKPHQGMDAKQMAPAAHSSRRKTGEFDIVSGEDTFHVDNYETDVSAGQRAKSGAALGGTLGGLFSLEAGIQIGAKEAGHVAASVAKHGGANMATKLAGVGTAGKVIGAGMLGGAAIGAGLSAAFGSRTKREAEITYKGKKK